MTFKLSALRIPLYAAPVILLTLTGCSTDCARSLHRASYVANASVVSIHQMGGDINVSDAPDGAKLATMGGDIHVGSVASFANLKTMGGSITVNHASGEVDAKTMGGAVTIHQVDGPVNASTMAGDVTVHLTGESGSRRDVNLSSMSGTILLTVPKTYGMDVHIKLAYTHEHEDARIVQHLGLTETQSTDWDKHNGSPRKYIYASGHVGDGANRVMIETINGDVILKQE